MLTMSATKIIAQELCLGAADLLVSGGNRNSLSSAFWLPQDVNVSRCLAELLVVCMQTTGCHQEAGVSLDA
jgi:hypothetical protein